MKPSFLLFFLAAALFVTALTSEVRADPPRTVYFHFVNNTSTRIKFSGDGNKCWKGSFDNKVSSNKKSEYFRTELNEGICNLDPFVVFNIHFRDESNDFNNVSYKCTSVLGRVRCVRFPIIPPFDVRYEQSQYLGDTLVTMTLTNKNKNPNKKPSTVVFQFVNHSSEQITIAKNNNKPVCWDSDNGWGPITKPIIVKAGKFTGEFVSNVTNFGNCLFEPSTLGLNFSLGNVSVPVTFMESNNTLSNTSVQEIASKVDVSIVNHGNTSIITFSDKGKPALQQPMTKPVQNLR
ncbi:hypothetical protein Bealeia1_01344 [Candidatus Bealeia paramacronuclearis]|uniref:Uncharacterized protein n=1 Tax=Candidatus Bealeia paramacronuclearis TaxID=1921001 RepID=A0ABZ2C4L7_9PROT|nr:hypothetical protein [Candidatus Bealeia paramacronuclearis]